MERDGPGLQRFPTESLRVDRRDGAAGDACARGARVQKSASSSLVVTVSSRHVCRSER
jgi:hypothetical protein